jgi:cell division protein FtsI/penicillin-binding protein 2
MASVVSLIANRGVSYKPHLLRSTLGPREGSKPEMFRPEVLGRIDEPSDRWDDLFRAMFHVISEGTARGSAQISGLEWGGKTGSAENQKFHETHSWFVGMAPLNSPSIVICVMVENAGHGSEVAAPIGARMVRYWLKERGRAPRVDIHSAENDSATLDTPSADETSPNSR